MEDKGLTFFVLVFRAHFLYTFPDSASWRLVQILCALQCFYLHEERSVEQEFAKFARDSLVLFNEKAVRKIYVPICFQSR